MSRVFFLCRAALCGDCLQKLARLLVQRIDEHEQLDRCSRSPA